MDKRIGAWKFGTSALYAGKRTDKQGTVDLGGYTTVDLHAEYQFAKDWAAQHDKRRAGKRA